MLGADRTRTPNLPGCFARPQVEGVLEALRSEPSTAYSVRLISFLAGLPNWGAGTLKSELVPGTSSISCEPQRTICTNV
jgi:hypothetical protein